MRLRGIKSITQANEFLSRYLPVFNRRFGVEPINPEDLHRPLPQGIDLDKILSVKTVRVLRNDFTVLHEGNLYQVEDSIRTKEVTVEERLNGYLLITYKGRALRYKKITQRLKKTEEPPKIRKIYIPPKDHPWRNFRVADSSKLEAKEEAFAGAL